MSVKLLTEHHLEFLSLKGGSTGSSDSTLVKIPYCWKSYGPRRKKAGIWGLRTTKVQTSLREFAQSDQHHLLFAYIQTCYKWNFYFLSSLCRWAGWFESHFVGNPKDRFSCLPAHMSRLIWRNGAKTKPLLLTSSFGGGNSIFLSILPGRNNAESKISILFVAIITYKKKKLYNTYMYCRKRSGSVLVCLTRDLGAPSLSFYGVTALCPWARTLILA